LHFIHVRSSHANAVPLLLLPPFPFTNLSFGHLIKPFTEPEHAAADQPFHLVIPSLPGLGFSDPLPNNTPVILTVADMLNTLMSRLSYQHYLVTNAGAATTSPAEIDWKLANHLVTHYYGSCLGAHLISPPLASPKLSEAPLEWAKWSIASFFHAGILGYSNDDFSALKRAEASALAAVGSEAAAGSTRRGQPTPKHVGLNKFGLREPNTLAYALCDSPTGLLVFVIKALSLLGPQVTFTPEQVLTFAQLAWLPGPEYAMRFWAACAVHDEAEERRKRDREGRTPAAKPKVSITVFLGGEDKGKAPAAAPEALGGEADIEMQAGSSNADVGKQVDLPQPMPHEETERYTCPAWGRTHYDVVHSQRLSGRPGLLAWERPEIIIAGARNLAKEVLRLDQRFRPAEDAETVPLEQVVTDDAGSSRGPTNKPDQPPPQSPTTEQGSRGIILSRIIEESPPPVETSEPPMPPLEPEVPPPQLQLSSADAALPAASPIPEAERPKLEDETGLGSSSTLDVSKEPQPDKSKEDLKEPKDSDFLAPPKPSFLAEKHVDSFSSGGGSPDTLVVETPPLDLASRSSLGSPRPPEPEPSPS
jgi:pimeloyl-ACP methyl ester carboxylesterase